MGQSDVYKHIGEGHIYLLRVARKLHPLLVAEQLQMEASLPAVLVQVVVHEVIVYDLGGRGNSVSECGYGPGDGEF